MVDFIEASPLRYALTVKPTVYVSHIRQFWSTARIETTEEGTQILATVDGLNRDAEIARIHAEEELHIMIDGLDRNNETVAKYLQEYHQFALELPMERRIELISDLVKYQDNYAKVHKFQSQQRKPWTKKQKKDYYMAVIRSNLGWKVKDFRGMTFKEVEAKFNSVWKQLEDFIPMGSKEEAERIKRKGSSASYQFFIDLLKHLDREDLNQLWRLVKETLSNRPPTSDKEMEL
nr:hypothetical protein [Tanacetum cinerariifolium]